MQSPFTRPSWPDTELLLNYTLREHGITPHLIGHEENHVRNKDKNIDHCRSITAGLLYNETYYKKARAWANEAIAEAHQRIDLWTSEQERMKQLRSGRRLLSHGNGQNSTGNNSTLNGVETSVEHYSPSSNQRTDDDSDVAERTDS